jgi:O-antigen/teichoic acid export membrane protein
VTAKVIGARLDRIILSAFLNASSLGLYSVGTTVKTALLVPFQAYAVGLFNDLLDEKKAGRSAYDSSMRAAVKWSVLMVMAALAVFVLAPLVVPFVFGPQFVPGVEAVRILAFAPAFECLSTQVLQWLLVEGRPSIVSRVQVLGAITLAVSTTVASIEWGLVGAAYAATMTAALVAGYALLAADRIRREG